MPTLAEAEALVRDLDGRPRMMVNQNFRFRPYYVQMRQWMRDNRAGHRLQRSIAAASGLIRNREEKYPYIERQPFVRGETRLMIEEVLIHRIDVARWLCGPLELIAARTGAQLRPNSRGSRRQRCCSSTGERGAPVVIDGNFMSHGHTERSQDRVEINRRARPHPVGGQRAAPDRTAHRRTLRFDEAVAYQQSFDATNRAFRRRPAGRHAIPDLGRRQSRDAAPG
jgi:predicted dehydrogenase